MERQEWLSQTKRGILEFSVLLLIDKKAMYGYDLITELNSWDVLSTSEGTMYPLLRRLEKEKLLKSSWQETVPGAPPRKYYNLTSEGSKMLETMNEEWQNFIDSIEEIQNKKEK